MILDCWKWKASRVSEMRTTRANVGATCVASNETVTSNLSGACAHDWSGSRSRSVTLDSVGVFARKASTVYIPIARSLVLLYSLDRDVASMWHGSR